MLAQRLRPLLLAAMLAVIAGGATYRVLERQPATEAPALSTVLIMTQTLPVGAVVADGHFRQARIPSEEIPEQAVRTAEDATGQYVAYPLIAGELLLRSKLSATPAGSTLSTVIPEGQRAVSVAVDDLLNSAGLISPGDRVDVLGVMTRAPGDLAEVVLRDVQVLAVADLILGTADDPRESDSRANGSGGRTITVTLSVTEEQAQRLVQVDEMGRLRLAMRPRPVGGTDAGERRHADAR